MKRAVFLLCKTIFYLFLFSAPILLLANDESKNLINENKEQKILFINQVMIGQNQAAKNEFIELYNPNPIDIDLSNYILRKKTKSGSESLLISNKNFKGIIPAQSYFLISSPEFCADIACDLAYQNNSSLSANNTIILYDIEKNIIDKLAYGQASDSFEIAAPEISSDQVLRRKRFDSLKPNNNLDYEIISGQIILHNSQGQKIELFLNPLSENLTTKNKTTKSKNDSYFLNLWELGQAKNNDNITVEGIVSVLPGVLGAQYFYIHSPKDDLIYGLQIYNYQKKFPNLKLGDLIRVSGKLGISELCSNSDKNCPPGSNFYRLKTKEAGDIKLLAEKQNLKIPPTKKIKDLSWQEIGSLQTISGEITQNKTNQIYLDDGETEILLKIKKSSQIPSKILSEGHFFTISGILNYKGSELELSIINIDHIKGKNLSEEESLGTLINDEFWQIEKQNYKAKIIKYIFITFLVGVFYIFYLKKIKK